MKLIGKPYAGEPHVRFEVAGTGNLVNAPDVGPTSDILNLVLKKVFQ